MTIRRGSEIALAAGLGAAISLAWVAEEVLEGDAARMDGAVRAWVHGLSNPALTRAMLAFSWIGSPGLLWALVAAALFLFWRAGRKGDAAFLGVAMLGAAGLEIGLKLAFHRARPQPFFDLAMPSSYSFPSGHALYAACFYGALAALPAARGRSRGARALLWTGAALMAALIGFSRIYLGVHYPSDVIAGFAAAALWIAVVYAAFGGRPGGAR